MSFEQDYLDVMNETITWEPVVGVNEYATPQYSGSVSVRCRISYKPRQVLDLQGNSTVASATIYTAGAYAIDAEDRITLPNGESPPIIRVNRPPDQDGLHHTEVMI